MTETQQRLPMFRYSTLGHRLVQETVLKAQAESASPTSPPEQIQVPLTPRSSSGSVVLFLGVASLLGYLSYRNLRDL